MYRVSPQLFVTSEHIMSDNDSTSSSFLAGGSCVGFLLERAGAGEVAALAGLAKSAGWAGVSLCEGVPSSRWCVEPPSCDAREEVVPVLAPVARFSERRFSSVPRSVLPSSSSERRPDSLNRLSMRPRRFSSPSMYLALTFVLVASGSNAAQVHSPFGWLALLFHLGEDAFSLVVCTMCAGWHFAIALDLLLATHVTSLRRQQLAWRVWSSASPRAAYPCNAPPLGVPLTLIAAVL